MFVVRDWIVKVGSECGSCFRNTCWSQAHGCTGMGQLYQPGICSLVFSPLPVMFMPM